MPKHKLDVIRHDPLEGLPLKLHSPLTLVPEGRVQIFSTITPISGNEFTGSIEPFRNVLTIWRARLRQLELQGWPVVSGSNQARMPIMLNCRPTACKVGLQKPESSHADLPGVNFRGEGSLWYCQRFNICPWCWARRVSVTYTKIDELLFPGMRLAHVEMEKAKKDRKYKEAAEADLQKQCLDYTIYIRKEMHTLGYGDPAPKRRTFPADVQFRIKCWRARKFQPYFQAHAAVESMCVDGDDADDTKVRVTYRQLLIYRAEDEPPEQIGHRPTPSKTKLGKKVHLKKFEMPTREQLIRAVASTMRYPVYMLRGRDLNQIVQLYDGLSKFKNVVYFGALRGQ